MAKRVSGRAAGPSIPMRSGAPGGARGTDASGHAGAHLHAWAAPRAALALAELLGRLPYMFPLEGADRERAYQFLRGWIGTFAACCAQIDTLLGNDKRGFHWVRIREKFGAPSFFYLMEGKASFEVNFHTPDEVKRVACQPREDFDEVAVGIQELVLQTQTRLRSQCIICGAPSSITNAQGPWASLCAFHASAVLPDDPQARMGPVWVAALLPQ